MAFRVFGGFAAGVASVVAPMYITEISPTRQRGVLGSLQQLGIVLGIFVSLLVNALLVHVSGGAGTMMGPMMTWQWMFLCMCVPALIYGVLAFTIPESPVIWWRRDAWTRRPGCWRRSTTPKST